MTAAFDCLGCRAAAAVAQRRWRHTRATRLANPKKLVAVRLSVADIDTDAGETFPGVVRWFGGRRRRWRGSGF